MSVRRARRHRSCRVHVAPGLICHDLRSKEGGLGRRRSPRKRCLSVSERVGVTVGLGLALVVSVVATPAAGSSVQRLCLEEVPTTHTKTAHGPPARAIKLLHCAFDAQGGRGSPVSAPQLLASHTTESRCCPRVRLATSAQTRGIRERNKMATAIAIAAANAAFVVRDLILLEPRGRPCALSGLDF